MRIKAQGDELLTIINTEREFRMRKLSESEDQFTVALKEAQDSFRQRLEDI